MNRTAPAFRAPLAMGREGFRGPFARWPRAADAVLAFAACMVTTFVLDAPGDDLNLRPIQDVPVGAFAASVVAGAALYWRRRAPLAVLAVALISWSVTSKTGYRDMGGLLAIIALYGVGRYSGDVRWGVAGVGAAALTVLVDALDDPYNPLLTEVIFGGAVMFVAWYAGHRLRLRQQRHEQLRREQAAESRRILVEERARIARELHDVVAHRVSLMTVQAGAAKAVASQDPDGALRAMGAVEEAGRQALAELRHLLGVLRPEADHGVLGPQPGLADLPRLADEIREAGVKVSLDDGDGSAPEVPARVDLFAYRIVQEALTNVLKHAGPGTRADVRLRAERDCLVIEVADDGRGGTALRGGTGGHGIVGMRERALLLGGTLDAGPRPGGDGFAVHARLPMGGEPA